LVSNGESEEIRRQVSLVEQATAVVVDLDACFALLGSGAIQYVLNAIPTVYVPQAAIDALTFAAHRKARAAKEEEQLLYVHNGELCQEEVPARVAQRFVADVMELRTLLLSHPHVQVIGATPGRPLALGTVEYAYLDDRIGKPTTEALFEASTRALLLLSGELFYQQAFPLIDIPTVSPLAALRHAAAQEKMSADVYHDAVIALIRHGYHLVPLGAQTLIRLATRSGFFLGYTERRVISSLALPQWDALSVFWIVCEFASWLWDDHEGAAADYPTVLFKSAAYGNSRQKWMDYLTQTLGSISRND
jgi:hypothetical protein